MISVKNCVINRLTIDRSQQHAKDSVVWTMCDLPCYRKGRKLGSSRSSLAADDDTRLVLMQLFQRNLELIHIWGNCQVFLNKILGTCHTPWWSQALSTCLLCSSIVWFLTCLLFCFYFLGKTAWLLGARFMKSCLVQGKNQKNSGTVEEVEWRELHLGWTKRKQSPELKPEQMANWKKPHSYFCSPV